MMTTAPSPETSVLTRETGRERDRRLRELAIEVLRSSGYLALRGLRCQVRDGIIFITGVVPSFYLKQVAQTVLLLMLKDAEGLENLVEVRPSGATGGPSPWGSRTSVPV